MTKINCHWSNNNWATMELMLASTDVSNRYGSNNHRLPSPFTNCFSPSSADNMASSSASNTIKSGTTIRVTVKKISPTYGSFPIPCPEWFCLRAAFWHSLNLYRWFLFCLWVLPFWREVFFFNTIWRLRGYESERFCFGVGFFSGVFFYAFFFFFTFVMFLLTKFSTTTFSC